MVENLTYDDRIIDMKIGEGLDRSTILSILGQVEERIVDGRYEINFNNHDDQTFNIMNFKMERYDVKVDSDPYSIAAWPSWKHFLDIYVDYQGMPVFDCRYSPVRAKEIRDSLLRELDAIP